MERVVARRRRAAAVTLAAFAIAAFAGGACFGAESRSSPDVASTLPPKYLAGERIVVGI